MLLMHAELLNHDRSKTIALPQHGSCSYNRIDYGNDNIDNIDNIELLILGQKNHYTTFFYLL